jgi:hypothetical protein
MNPRIESVKYKKIAVIIIDALLFFLLVFASYAFFSKPARAENVESPPDRTSAGLTLAPEPSVDGNTSSEINNSEGKVFVCKYVGTPGVDERFQTGDNPISVSISAIPDYQGIGSWFADEQGRSYVLAEDVGQPEPPVTDCPPVGSPTPTTPPTATFTPTFTSTPTATEPPSATATETQSPPPTPTETQSPPATPTKTQVQTATPTPPGSVTLAPTRTATSKPSATNTLQASPTQSSTRTPTPTATSSTEVLTCSSCDIVEDFRQLIVSGLYTADLLNTEEISSTFKVSITLYDGYKRVIVGQTKVMTDIQPAGEIMQVKTPLWCLNTITNDVYWTHTIASAQKSTGEIWFALDEWVRINLTAAMVIGP